MMAGNELWDNMGAGWEHGRLIANMTKNDKLFMSRTAPWLWELGFHNITKTSEDVDKTDQIDWLAGFGTNDTPTDLQDKQRNDGHDGISLEKPGRSACECLDSKAFWYVIGTEFYNALIPMAVLRYLVHNKIVEVKEETFVQDGRWVTVHFLDFADLVPYIPARARQVHHRSPHWNDAYYRRVTAP
jgi:hypothetical protein